VAESGAYRLTVRIASSGTGGRFHVEANGADVSGPLAIPDTGGYQTWRDVTTTVTLTAGLQRIRFVADAASAGGVFGNLNFMRFTR
jgi:hypothetical protein